MRWLAASIALLTVLAAAPAFTPVRAAEPEPSVTALFFETDVREALGEVMLQTGVNIIVDDTVRGTVTLDLADVPLEKALDMIVLAGGFTYRKVEDFYVVGLPDPRSPTFHHLADTEAVALRYITAAEARELLPGIYERYLKAAPDRDVLTITAPPDLIERFRRDLARIDRPRRQVMIQAIVTEVSTEVVSEWGSQLFEFTVGAGQRVNPDWVSMLGFEADVFSLATDVYGELLLRLRALEGKDQAKIRANPRIAVADRATAQLFVGEQQLLILEPVDAPARVERVEVGVSLAVTPRIVGDDEIELRIAPEISHFTEERQEGLVVRRSELSTTVRARRGQTLVLGGITVEGETALEQRVPLLGWLPLVGRLFRRAGERGAQRELLIFLTPEIL